MALWDSLMEMVIDESSTLHRATFGFRIKNRQNLDVTLKKHSYMGYMDFLKTIKDLDDINYMRQDINITINTIKTIRDRIEKINRLGENDPAVRNYVKNIKSKYIDKGITVKDCDQTIEWFETDCRKALNDRAKELRK